jgi:hypothetical protein
MWVITVSSFLHQDLVGASPAREPVDILSTDGRKGGLGPPSADMARSGADLVGGGVGRRGGINLRRFVNQLRQDLGHVCVGATVAFLDVPIRAAALKVMFPVIGAPGFTDCVGHKHLQITADSSDYRNNPSVY